MRLHERCRHAASRLPPFPASHLNRPSSAKFSSVTINPYNPPATDSTSNESGCLEVPFGWRLCFWLLVASIVVDLGIVLSRLTLGGHDWVSSSMPTLTLVALAQSLMVFSMRWILFRLILRRPPTGGLRGVVPLVGVIIIFTMLKLIEFQGFRLWSGSGQLAKFLIFLVPSLALMLCMTPRRLVQFQTRRQQVKPDRMEGATICP